MDCAAPTSIRLFRASVKYEAVKVTGLSPSTDNCGKHPGRDNAGTETVTVHPWQHSDIVSTLLRQRALAGAMSLNGPTGTCTRSGATLLSASYRSTSSVPTMLPLGTSWLFGLLVRLEALTYWKQLLGGMTGC